MRLSQFVAVLSLAPMLAGCGAGHPANSSSSNASGTSASASNSAAPLSAETGNNTSAANNFSDQSNGNLGANNVSKVDIHSLLYPGATTKVFVQYLLWFGQSNHMNIGYASNDAGQVQRQIDDMVSRGIDGVIIDWYGPNNAIDQGLQLVASEAEQHPGFTFAIMMDQGAIQFFSCGGCSPQEVLTSDMQYAEQKYFTSSAYLQVDGK